MPKSNNTLNRIKFTTGRVNAFKCAEGLSEQLLWDTDEKTLCIRARQSGARSYYYQSRFEKKVIKIRIGDLSDKGLTHDDARTKAREFQSLVDRGIDPRLEIKRKAKTEVHKKQEQKKQDIKFRQVWDDYISENKRGWSELHLKDHVKAMQAQGVKRKRGTGKTVAGVLYKFRSTRLGDFSPVMIKNWINKESKDRPTVTARGYRLLRACLNWADGQDAYHGIVNTGRLFSRDVSKVLTKGKPKQDALESQHLPLWFKAVQSIDNPVIATYLQGLLITGARRGELAGLTWDDVDFQWRSIKIKDKVEGERVIPLTPYLANLLNALPRRNEWVFSSPQAKSGRLQDPYRNHANALVMAGLPPVSLHGLRRSFGSLSEWVECPVGIVAQIQGHKPSATAEKHYRVRPIDLLRLWHTKIEKQILGFGGIEQPEELNEGLRVVK